MHSSSDRDADKKVCHSILWTLLLSWHSCLTVHCLQTEDDEGEGDDIHQPNVLHLPHPWLYLWLSGNFLSVQIVGFKVTKVLKVFSVLILPLAIPITLALRWLVLMFVLASSVFSCPFHNSEASITLECSSAGK